MDSSTKDISRLTRYIIAAAVVAIVVFLVWYFSNIVTYILLAAVITLIGNPLNKFLRRTHIKNMRMPNWLASIVTLLIIWGGAIAFFLLFTPLIFNKVSELSQLDLSAFASSFHEPLSKINHFLEEYFAVSTSTHSITENMAQSLSKLLNLNQVGNLLTSLVSFVADTAIGLFSITFISFFFFKEENLFKKMLAALFPPRYEENINRAINSVSYLLSRYFVGLLAEVTIMMLMVSIGLLICGFAPSEAFFMGLVMGVLQVIPYIGPWLGLAISIFVGAASTMGVIPFPRMLMMICGSVLVAEMIDNFIVQPALFSKQVNAHPLEIFIVILVGGSVGGVVGMLIAIPSYTVVRVFAREFFNHFALVRKLTDSLPDEEDMKPKKERKE